MSYVKNESHETAINPHRETGTIEVEIISNTEGQVQFEDVLVELLRMYNAEAEEKAAAFELLTEIGSATHKRMGKGGRYEC